MTKLAKLAKLERDRAWEDFRKRWNFPKLPPTHRDRVIFEAGWDAGINYAGVDTGTEGD